MKENPRLCIVIPCYNEEQVLPITAPLFLDEINSLISKNMVAGDSRILLVDDGSKDDTWGYIQELAKNNSHFMGIRQSRNRGHQNAVLAGLMEAKEEFDITISIDCDGQDDISSMEEMVSEYHRGSEIVYGVRSSRATDTFFKRFTAQSFYRLLNFMGVECVYNHADYRLVSAKVLKELENYKEVNLFLRGMIPLIGFKSSIVYYERHTRMAGESSYPLGKMISLALDGITSLSIKPIRFITGFGIFVALMSFVGVIWSVLSHLFGTTVSGWSSMVSIICFVSGVQLICMGVLGEYIGKIYLETKARPRYIISDRTQDSVNKD